MGFFGNLEGQANNRGFMVEIWALGKNMGFYTPDYLEGEKEILESALGISGTVMHIMLTGLFLLGFMSLYLIMWFLSGNIITTYMLFFGIGCFYFAAERASSCRHVVMNKDVRQWHACEHKINNLLEKDQLITAENILRADSVSSRCGSFISIAIIVCGLFVVSVGPFVENILVMFPLTIVLYVAVAQLGLYRFFQRQFFLAEPAGEKYEVALELGKNINVWAHGVLQEYDEEKKK